MEFYIDFVFLIKTCQVFYNHKICLKGNTILLTYFLQPSLMVGSAFLCEYSLTTSSKCSGKKQ